MNNLGIVGPALDNAKRHLSNVDEAMATYWSRSISDADGQMTDVRRSVEALSSAIAAVAQAVERLAELPAPELLAALTGLSGLLADVENEPECDPEILRAIYAAREAIAKAEGREP